MGKPFALVGEETSSEPIVPPVKEPEQSFATDMLLLALRALAQRTIVAISNCFTLIGLAGGWFLFWQVLDNPTPYQLAGVSLYGVFFIALEVVRRRK